MKICSFIIVFLLLFACDDIGKDFHWQKNTPGFSRHYGTVGYDYGWSGAYSPFDNGLIIIGQISPQINGQSDLWVIKTNNRGLAEWDKKFGGNNDEAGYDVISTSDGGFLLVGYTWSFGNEQQVYAIKIDFYGNLEWEKTFGGTMWEIGNSVIEVFGGGYIIAGSSNSPGISSGNTDFYLIKIDVNGDLIWEKSYGNQAFPNHEWAYDLVQNDNKEIMVVGARDRYDKGSMNGLVYFLDESGNLIWEKEFVDDSQISESIYSVSKSIDGFYYLCTTLNSINSNEIYKPKISKMDALGNIGWQRILPASGREYHQFKVSSSSLGGAVIAGTSSLELGSGYKEDAFMTKVDESGSILWSHAYGSEDEDDWGWSIFETPMTNLVLVGSTKSYGSSLFDILLVGTDSNGILE